MQSFTPNYQSCNAVLLAQGCITAFTEASPEGNSFSCSRELHGAKAEKVLPAEAVWTCPEAVFPETLLTGKQQTFSYSFSRCALRARERLGTGAALTGPLARLSQSARPSVSGPPVHTTAWDRLASPADDVFRVLMK